MCLPIIGVDFLKHYDLLVDVRWQKLNHTTTNQLAATASADDYATLKQTFKGVFQGKLGATKAPAKHPVKHYIKTTGPPVYARFQRLAPDRLAAAKRCFQEIEKQGLCQKASSPWASPLHIVVKKDGTIRPCGDYRRLNNITEADHYPQPNIADVTSFLHGATVFSKLDLMKGYFQVPMHPEDMPKTAIKCWGHLPTPHGRHPREPALFACVTWTTSSCSPTRGHSTSSTSRSSSRGSARMASLPRGTSVSSGHPKLNSWATPSHASGSRSSGRRSRPFRGFQNPPLLGAFRSSWDW